VAGIWCSVHTVYVVRALTRPHAGVMMCGGCGVQVVAYTILDIISKVVFSFMIVSAHDSLGSTSPQTVQSREYV
jgi:bacteriorhodopsin